MLTLQQPKIDKDKKGKIEISLCERTITGEPTSRKRSFQSDKGSEVSDFWTDNRQSRKASK